MTNITDNLDPIHDILAVGCGPFNLGLSALSSTVDDLKFTALEAGTSDFRWHSGLMLDDAMLQVGFLADLVSLVDPTHPLSFLNYLKERERLYFFYVREQFHMTRREYEDYLRWATNKLSNIRYEHSVRSICWDDEHNYFVIRADTATGPQLFHAHNVAVGIGTEPAQPSFLSDLPRNKWIHSSQYLHRIREVLSAKHVTVVGSGQSGAEVILDLLRRRKTADSGLSWFTRTGSFAPLDYSKLVLEMTTPDYVDYFHSLSEEKRDELVRDQWRHYKGISSATLEQIHSQLYARAVESGGPGAELRCAMAVQSATLINDKVQLNCRQSDTGEPFNRETELVIAATGYKHRIPEFLSPLSTLLSTDQQGRYVVNRDHSIKTTRPIRGQIFVSNADLHSHGVAAPDLGLCAVRNATVINRVMGREIYTLPKRTAFTQFGSPVGMTSMSDEAVSIGQGRSQEQGEP